MKKLIISSTLVMLGYAIVLKIVSKTMWAIRQIWEIPLEMSMNQYKMLLIMDSAKDVLIFIGGALFVFLVVNILVTAYENKHKVSKVE